MKNQDKVNLESAKVFLEQAKILLGEVSPDVIAEASELYEINQLNNDGLGRTIYEVEEIIGFIDGEED